MHVVYSFFIFSSGSAGQLTRFDLMEINIKTEGEE